jgi:hypothetical protein
MTTQFILEMLIGVLRGFLLNNKKAAQFAKYLLRARDYILLLFPLEMYPEGKTDDPMLKAGVDVKPVELKEVKKASKEFGFNLPFIKGR